MSVCRGGRASAGQEREVTGVHDEAGVQVQTLWGDRNTDRVRTDPRVWRTKTSFLSASEHTLVEVEFLVGGSVSESLNVHQVAVDVWVVQSAERHVCRAEIWSERTPGPGLQKHSNTPVLPAVFCFLMGGAREEPPCIPVATTTCVAGTLIMVEAGRAGAGVMETAVFLTVFLGDSEEIGTRLSSYSFLFTVLFIWALRRRRRSNLSANQLPT